MTSTKEVIEVDGTVGGKAPLLVLDDADLDDAVNAAAALTTWFTSATAKLNALPGAPTPTAPITIGTITGSTSNVKA